MSTADMLEDGFPHATPAGWKRGCRLGSHCPGIAEVGWSCEDAHIRYQGDYGYRRRVDEGWSPDDIADWQKSRASERAVTVEVGPVTVTPVDVPAAPLPVKKPRLVEPKPKKAEAAKPEQPSEEKPARGPEAKPINHGTPYGYQRGCRDREGKGCPGGEDGLSCWQAYRNYQNDYRARRLVNEGAAPLGSNAGMPLGSRREAVTVDGVKRVKSKLPVAVSALVTERDARIADLEAALARIAEDAPEVPDGHGRHRAEVSS